MLTPDDPLYRVEDAQQILQIAIARQVEAGELSRSQLFEIAAELNIDTADIVAAEQEWRLRTGELAEQQVFDQMRHHQFRSRLIRFAIFVGGLVVLNLLLGSSWIGSAIYYLSLLLGGISGIRLTLAAWKTYGLSEEDYRQAFQRWRQRQQLKRSLTSWVNRRLGLQ
ncbi:MAG: 2TM domain-containing protein [Elainella sp. Prado103]|jgi:hypothetical protein|nr:2TM domain-containing protein [Elainella sp. Prado103]